MQPFTLFCVLATILPAHLVLAHHRGNGGNFGGNGGNFGGAPSTFITVVPVAAPTSDGSSGSTTSSGSGDSSSSSSSGAVDASLVPDFGVTAGVSLNDGTPRCAGLNGKAIDCDCPPSLDDFVNGQFGVASAVASGAQFPSGNSAADQLTRLQTCLVVLQNIKGGPGSGVGCPAVSTTWLALQSQLQSEAKI